MKWMRRFIAHAPRSGDVSILFLGLDGTIVAFPFMLVEFTRRPFILWR
jgi:hypothetical protein